MIYFSLVYFDKLIGYFLLFQIIGKVLLTDNWRLMHGRAAFSGRRIMGGCYLDNDDFNSKALVLGIDVD